MSLSRIPVDTTNLGIGMYVAMLDRPWLETPFVFQGFEIRERFEIEQLQSHCSYVYVDIDRGRLTEAQIRALAGAPAKAPEISAGGRLAPKSLGWFGRLSVRFGLADFLAARFGRGSTDYKVTSTVRREAPRARDAYERSVQQYRRLFDRARWRGGVDVADVAKAVTPLFDSILRNPDAMAWTVFSRKRNGRNYSRAVATAVWSIMFGRHLGFDRQGLRDLATGGLLLDIGNVDLPDEIRDAEGAITIEDYERHIVRHVEAGVTILSESKGFGQRVLDMVQCHHERHDGSGYPRAMQGSEIPIYGRIAGIVDCYDAMTTKTPYSPALAAYDAARELNEMRDKQFQGEVVEQFLQTIGMFPTGSIVELSDGIAGLVLEQNRNHPLRPKVLLLLDRAGQPLDKRRTVDMQQLPDAGRTGAHPVWIARGHEHGAFGIDPLSYFT